MKKLVKKNTKKNVMTFKPGKKCTCKCTGTSYPFNSAAWSTGMNKN